VFGLLLLAGLILVATGATAHVLGWAWERHANILSWYVRPLFLLPLAYVSYKRWISGIVVTLVALATSMAWFPAPGSVPPEVAEFLAFERAWLTSGWTPEKVLSWTLVVVGLATLCLAFWKRSLAYGLVVTTTLAVGKMAWGVVEGRGTGWAMLVPAMAGLMICNGGVLYAMRRRGGRSSHGSPDVHRDWLTVRPLESTSPKPENLRHEPGDSRSRRHRDRGCCRHRSRVRPRHRRQRPT
jgi:hypothetical protein